MGPPIEHDRIPLLAGDRLVLKDESKKKRLMCFNAKTGQMLWTYPCKVDNYQAMQHLRLTSPGGAPVDVLVLTDDPKIVRVSDGKELGECRADRVPVDSMGSGSVIAGKYLTTQGETTGPWGRMRQDNLATCAWRIFDISDPAKPRKVNQGLNLLGYKDPPADYIAKRYLAEFDPLLFVGCYRGTPSYFGTDLAGVVPHGNKLLIQSRVFLYYIGEK